MFGNWIKNFKTFWFYKGLLLWAKAREGKVIDNNIFNKLKDIKIYQKYHLDDMVCITYMQLLKSNKSSYNKPIAN